MKRKLILTTLFIYVFSACSQQSSNNTTTTFTSCTTYSGTVPSGPNVLSISVGAGSVCSQGGYVNEPCTTVTVCNPGTGTCANISDILVDTGSFGLRIFRSVLTSAGITPTPATLGANTVGECAMFGTANEWGQVETLDVGLGGESKISNLPVQVIDSSFATVSSNCTSAGTSPASEGFNGILGVGLFTQDCGAGCQTDANNNMYYSCSGSTCTSTRYLTTSQVVNPVAKLSKDNNGVLVEIPSVPTSGAPNTTGYLILGIGTQSNNTPSGTKTFPADSNFGVFTVEYGGSSYTNSFIDSGSNGLFFPGTLATCSSSSVADGFFCPSTTQGLSATNQGSSGSSTAGVSFQVANAVNLLNTGNLVFTNLGGSNSDFDWGLPFFLGCKVYVGLEGTTSSLGSGPYWSY